VGRACVRLLGTAMTWPPAACVRTRLLRLTPDRMCTRSGGGLHLQLATATNGARRMRSADGAGTGKRRRLGVSPGDGSGPKGFLVVNKPAGVQSTKVVSRIKFLLEGGCGHRVKVGHGGTLDPLAQGVLVLGVGEYTKKLSGLLDGQKRYFAVGELGTATDTMDNDRNSTVTATAPWQHVGADQLRAAAGEFVGSSLQRPPMYSAVRLGGKRLYNIARKGNVSGQEAEGIRSQKARTVVIHGVDVCTANECYNGGAPIHLPSFGLMCDVGGGTYIRSLISDVAERVSTVAHMTYLIRLAHGPFALGDCMPNPAGLFLPQRDRRDDPGGQHGTDAAHGLSAAYPQPLYDHLLKMLVRA